MKRKLEDDRNESQNYHWLSWNNRGDNFETCLDSMVAWGMKTKFDIKKERLIENSWEGKFDFLTIF